MKTKLFLFSIAIVLFTLSIDAQIKLHSSGGISIGSETDPGADIISLDNATIIPGGIDDTPYFRDGLKSGTIEMFNDAVTIEGQYGDISFTSGQNNYLSINTDQDYFKFNEGIDIDDEVYIYSSGSGSFKMESTYGYFQISTSPTPYIDIKTGSGNFRFNKPVWYNSTLLYSDIRIKENITKIKDKGSVLEKITQLEGLEYNFIADEEKKRLVGLSAQDLQEVIPELVAEDENEILAVDYNGLIPYLLEAIKEQQKLIESLQDQVYNLSGDVPIQKGTSNESAPEVTQASFSDLFQNTPNPFSDETMIKYFLDENVLHALIYIYDLTGKQLKNYRLSDLGNGELRILSGELDPGTYIYTLITDGKVIGSRQMILTN